MTKKKPLNPQILKRKKKKAYFLVFDKDEYEHKQKQESGTDSNRPYGLDIYGKSAFDLIDSFISITEIIQEKARTEIKYSEVITQSLQTLTDLFLLPEAQDFMSETGHELYIEIDYYKLALYYFREESDEEYEKRMKTYKRRMGHE